MNSNRIVRLFKTRVPIGQSILFGIVGALCGDLVLSSCLWIFSFGPNFSEFFRSVLKELFPLTVIGTISGAAFHTILPNSKRFWIFFIAAAATVIGFVSLAMMLSVDATVSEVRTLWVVVAILVIIVVRILVEARRRFLGA